MHKFIPLLFVIISLHGFAQNDAVIPLSAETFFIQISKDESLLIDVRTKSEFENGHLDKAGQINYYSFDFKQRLLLLSQDAPIYLYCNTGYRSQKAAEFLKEEGYTKVYNLSLGIMDWNLKGYPVIESANAKPGQKDKMQVDEFNALLHNNTLVFVDFYAPWCPPCRKMMSSIDSLSKVYQNKVRVVKINSDVSKKLVKVLEVSTVPYFVFYKQGKLIYSHKGIMESHEIQQLFDSEL